VVGSKDEDALVRRSVVEALANKTHDTSRHLNRWWKKGDATLRRGSRC